MQTKIYRFNGRRRIFSALLLIPILAGIAFFINRAIRAESENNSQQSRKIDDERQSFTAPTASAPVADIGERSSVWLKLQAGKSLETTYYGGEKSISALRGNRAEPVSQVAADFNADGYADLISGFRNSGANGGLLALRRASREAFMPQDEQILADLRNGVFPNSFEKNATVIEIPTAPDFIVTGKFTQDSAVDLVFAARGGHSIYLMTSDGSGGFNQPLEIAVGGEITALAANLLNLKTGTYAGVIAAVKSEKSSFIAVFDGSQELGKAAPRHIKIEGDVTSLILASACGGAISRDVFGLADGDVFTIRGIDTLNASVEKIELPFKSTGIAVGEFIADRQARAEIAVLAENGSVAYLTRGTPDTRPFTAQEMEVFYATHERGADSPVAPVTDGLAREKWQISEEYPLGVDARGVNSSPVLQKAYITGNETEDLLITDSPNKRVRVLFKEPNRDENRASFTGETKTQSVDFSDSPAAVLPMRLNVMGQQGFVYFGKDSLEPTPVMLAPNATFNVTTANDENNGACSAAGTGCSVREAVIAANGAGGADMITFGINATHTHTIAGNDNTAAAGDLDITDGLTFVGNGAANTIIQAGATTATGIDKVFAINPALTTAFATSFSGMTIRNGNNAATTGGSQFGGAMEWDASGTGTLSFSNVTVTASQTTNSNGGGIFSSSSILNSAVITLANSTVSSNAARRTNTAGANGGGIFVGANIGLQVTGSVIANNTAVSTAVTPNIGNGGGVFLNVTPSSAGRPFFTNTSISGNTTADAGGGIYTNQPMDVNPLGVISNNTTTAGTAVNQGGGGIYINGTGNTVISKATMVGNSTTRSGGAILLDNAGGNPTLNMTFSRIVGNSATSFSGVAVEDSAATATVENNWWGCNGGPGTAGCDTVGTVGTGSFDFNPWLRYTHTASPNPIVVGQSTTLTASFLTNSDGSAIAASSLNVLFGLPAVFNAPVRGTISGSPTTVQTNGTATATFTANAVGTGSANAAVDNGAAVASITINQAGTTTAVTSNANPSVFGQTVTFTATVSVTAPGSGVPTGTIQFRDNGVAITGCTSVAAAGGQAQCSTGALAVGSHPITAAYSGDTNFAASTSPTLTQIVNKANTTTTITADTPDPSVRGQAITVAFTVTVNAPGAGTPTGSVTVTDGVNSCTGTVAAGQCSLTLNTVGARTLTATYAGDINFNTSSDTESHQVNLAGTTTTITADTPDPSGTNQPVTVSYTVTVNSPGTGTPTGSVTVSDGVNSCTATVAAGQCVITLTTVGARTLTATYAGDAGFNGSTSPGAPHTVLPSTAASVSIGGRVLTTDGSGLLNARVTLTDSMGNTRTITTRKSGVFHFDDVEAGAIYIIRVGARRYTFQPRVVSATQNLTGIDFVAAQPTVSP